MQGTRKLSPAEKERLNKSLSIVARLATKENLSQNNAFVMRERMRLSLKILGASYPTRIMIADGIEIMKDAWPFKIRRLRKLAYGRGSSQ